MAILPLPAVRLALVGDYDADTVAHVAIPRAVTLAAEQASLSVEIQWVATTSIPSSSDLVRRAFEWADGIWAVPRSPYASTDGALAAIRHARESRRPFLGTCAGFQHAIIEFARNVVGLHDASHAETEPEAARLAIVPLSCSLVEVSGTVRFRRGGRLHALYGVDEMVEGYHCNYGLNRDLVDQLDRAGLRVDAEDESGDPRAVVLDGHPFFVATLYQPERSALGSDPRPHPVIAAFVAAAAEAARRSGPRTFSPFDP